MLPCSNKKKKAVTIKKKTNNKKKGDPEEKEMKAGRIVEAVGLSLMPHEK